jgi:hypothetical protein
LIAHQSILIGWFSNDSAKLRDEQLLLRQEADQ